jgi:hypothetical protein
VIRSHDPPLIREREHRHVLKFAYRRFLNGEVESDFGPDNTAALAFAARLTSATSSGHRPGTSSVAPPAIASNIAAVCVVDCAGCT